MKEELWLSDCLLIALHLGCLGSNPRLPPTSCEIRLSPHLYSREELPLGIRGHVSFPKCVLLSHKAVCKKHLIRKLCIMKILILYGKHVLEKLDGSHVFS